MQIFKHKNKIFILLRFYLEMEIFCLSLSYQNNQLKTKNHDTNV